MASKHRLGNVLWNAMGYFSGQVGLMLFSVFTFRLFTRLLTKSDYGLLSLTNSTLSITGMVIGLGLPNAVVRFAPEYGKDKDAGRYYTFNATILAGSIMLA